MTPTIIGRFAYRYIFLVCEAVESLLENKNKHIQHYESDHLGCICSSGTGRHQGNGGGILHPGNVVVGC